MNTQPKRTAIPADATLSARLRTSFIHVGMPMDYRKHYDLLIGRARTRLLSGYKESHHVLPRCLGGSDDAENLVDLTPEEHYTAHLLLVKIYPGVAKLIYAANMMTVNNPLQRRVQNKLYGWIRRELDTVQRARVMSPEVRNRMSEAQKGHPVSDSTRKRQSAAMKGRKYPPEFGAAISARRKGRATRTGAILSQETKDKIALSLKQRGHADRIVNAVNAMTPEQRSEKSRRSWETRRANLAKKNASQ